MRRPVTLVTLAAVAAIWLAAILATPTLGAGAPVVTSTPSTLSRAGVVTGALVYLLGSVVCHQRPERSFHRDGAQLPVCARCLGLYAGGALGVLAWAALSGLGARTSRPARRLIESPRLRLAVLLLALPTIGSVATAVLGVWDAPNTARALLALPTGGAIGALVAAVAAGDLR